ncbi:MULTISPECIES: TetR/AcrR family transcriptional regulator [unclassified Streptomyces]|uniref:TetR/AcrR family transcriptional regulator n=1 Tax=unclassified Streptomyces TaxID=2593676 RepID=UPI000939B6CC|nr:TetR/AcrR family transcriptional regulator [Streptomyces sp. CB02400]OKK05112.1 TetR family transcriptional regulator [Streptomyces sp. CB02400]
MQGMSEKGAAQGGLRERKKRATRAALAEAAVRLAAEHGAEKVTVEAISAAAGVSVRTFFNYFDTRDDAFVVIDADAGARMRQAVLDAPAALSPLQALREALAAELAEAEQQHELWRLHAQVVHASPHLLVRTLGAHMADETGLAEAVAARIRAGGPTASVSPPACATDEERRGALDLYPRLLAAVAGTAVRTSVEHWSARPEEAAFLDVFQEVFALLAAGLPAPPA